MPPGHRAGAPLAVRGRRVGGEVYYAALMRFAGCAATSHEAAALLGGDDIAVRVARRPDRRRPARSRPSGSLPGWAQVSRSCGAGARPPCRQDRRGVGPGGLRGRRRPGGAAAAAGAPCGRPSSVPSSASTARDRLPGWRATTCRRRHGSPRSAYAAVMFDAVGGAELAVETVARWSGRALDPSIAAIFLEAPAELLTSSTARRCLGRGGGHRAAAAAMFPGRGPPGRGARRLRRCSRPQVAVLPGALSRSRAAGPGRCVGSSAGSIAALDPTGRACCTTSAESPSPPVSGSGQVRCGPRNGSWCACTRTTRDASCPGRRCCNRWRRSSADITSASTGRATRQACGGRAGSRPPACSPPPTSGARWAKHRPHRAALAPVDAARVISRLPLDRDAVRAVLEAADAPQASFPPLPVNLTERELEVLRLLSQRAHQTPDRRSAVSSRTRRCTPTRCTSTPSAASRRGRAWPCSPCGTVSRQAAAEPPKRASDSIDPAASSCRGPCLG